MEQRINAFATGNKAMDALHRLGGCVSQSTLSEQLLELLYFRVSQINGCAFCLDMHSKKLRANGETEQRLYLMAAWREAPFYTGKERAALAWAEAVTMVSGGLLSDEIYTEAKKHFTETELVELTMAVVAINSYNRVNFAFGKSEDAYNYQP